MNWFLVALVGPLIWSFGNHIDKYLLSKNHSGGKVGALMIFSTLIGFFVVIPILVFYPEFISVSFSQGLSLIIIGFLSGLWVMLYLNALDQEEASIVVPFFQIIPIFGLILGFLFLGETLSLREILASIVIILGALVLTMEIEEDSRNKFKIKIAIMMITASLIIALSEVWFKDVALESNFLGSFFWENIGLSLFGVILYLIRPKWRKDFRDIITKNRISFTGLNLINEILNTLGMLAFRYASLLAPIALVMLANTYQPVFVFIGAIILTVYFPKIASEKISRAHIIHKSVAIIIILLGTMLLYL